MKIFVILNNNFKDGLGGLDNMEYLNRFRVWGHTETSISSPFYEGKIDVWAEDEDDARETAQKECMKAHNGRKMVITRVEQI